MRLRPVVRMMQNGCVGSVIFACVMSLANLVVITIRVITDECTIIPSEGGRTKKPGVDRLLW